MKQLPVFLIFLILVACVPAPLTLVPVDTVVAQTMAALPAIPTPTLAPEALYTPTSQPPGTETVDIDRSAPGASCVPAETPRTRALVTRVLDGATIEVVIGYDVKQVKYIGLAVPRLIQPFEWQAPQSAAANQRLVSGQVVVLVKDTSDFDANGFLTRYVFAGNVFVNYDLIRQGMAKLNIVPPDVACQDTFKSAQLEAQSAMIGVWQPTPVPSPTITLTPLPTLSPTPTTKPVCDCSHTYTCKDFASTSAAQACFDYCLAAKNIQVLPDKNGNGRVCEGGAG